MGVLIQGEVTGTAYASYLHAIRGLTFLECAECFRQMEGNEDNILPFVIPSSYATYKSQGRMTGSTHYQKPYKPMAFESAKVGGGEAIYGGFGRY